jgi:integrase
MGGRGMTVRLRYIQAFEDRHGHERFYFRKAGSPRVALPGAPGSPAFMAAYNDALTGQKPAPALPKPSGADGSFDRLIAEYLRSAKFLKLKASSQAVTRGILTRFAAVHGHRIVAEMQPMHVERILGGMASTPAAANNLLKKLRVLLKFGRRLEYLTGDPTADTERFAEGTHHTWTSGELAQFAAHWPLGTRERTGFALALYTGQRRADLVNMTWHHIDTRAGFVRVIQEKTGTELDIPMHRDLVAALKAWPQHHINVLGLKDGRGTSVAAFGNLMADAIEAAGLPERCVLHGLRKASATRLAEAGCTTHEIQSITGHKSLDEVERYTRAAGQKKLSRSAITKLERSVNPDSQGLQFRKKNK